MSEYSINLDSSWTLDDIEKEIFLITLEMNLGNRVATCRQLDIGIRTLQRRFKRWGIPKGESAGNKKNLKKDSESKVTGQEQR